MKTKKNIAQRRQPSRQPTVAFKPAPFIEHLLELRRRLFIVAASVVAWSGIAYLFENQIIYWLLKPANGEKFIYTSPGGGIDFLIKVCLYAGIIMSAPIIIYQLLKFLKPLIGHNSSRFIILTSLTAGLLAVAGVLFGYFFGLPVALRFLLNQFQVSDITALITISSYLSFVIAYLAGASLIFQVPLWMFIINKITPLKLGTLAKNQRWVILIAFIVAALINPSPRPQDLFLLALPMILSYEIGILIVWYSNRHMKHDSHIRSLLDGDRQTQTERLAKLQTMQHILEPLEKPARAINQAMAIRSTSHRNAPRHAGRPRQHLNDFTPARDKNY